MGDVAADFEEFGENYVEDGEHHEWAEKCPEIAEDGTLITEFEIGFSKLL